MSGKQRNNEVNTTEGMRELRENNFMRNGGASKGLIRLQNESQEQEREVEGLKRQTANTKCCIMQHLQQIENDAITQIIRH